LLCRCAWAKKSWREKGSGDAEKLPQQVINNSAAVQQEK
jgi:hypothetical protein